MMIVLLLLGAFVCMGRSDEIKLKKDYGSSHQFQVPRKTHSIEFNPKDKSDVRILWIQGSHPTLDGRHTRMGRFFTVRNFTQKDIGRYIMRGKDQEVLSTYTLDITAIIKTYGRHHGEGLRLTYDLEPDSCNIYYFSQGGVPAEIVRQGKLQRNLDRIGCKGFELLKPCGISNDALQMTCHGHLEIRDQNNNKALMVYLTMQAISRTYDRFPGGHLNFTLDLEPHSCNIYFYPRSEPFDIRVVNQGKLQEDLDRSGCKGFGLLKPCGISNDALQMSCQGDFHIRDQNDNTALEVSLIMKPSPASYINNGIAFSLAILFCGFMGRCFCGGTPSKKRAVTSAAKPDVKYQEYDREPVGPRPDQFSRPSRTHTRTVLLIHSHPDMNGPPASSEVSAPAEPADAPTAPAHSDPAPRFELKGMTCFTSDSNHCEVYTSDKLNFL